MYHFINVFMFFLVSNYIFLFLPDLKTVEQRLNSHVYKKLADFIGDMTKIFDNCRYYNPRSSPFYNCAEMLESYFVQKIKLFRESIT